MRLDIPDGSVSLLACGLSTVTFGLAAAAFRLLTRH
jgi:hypothetical protein